MTYDYQTTGEPRQRRFYPEALGTSVLEMRTGRAGTAVLRAAASLNGLVRASERAAGAVERGEDTWVSIQTNTAKRSHGETIDALIRIQNPTADLMEELTQLAKENADALSDARRSRTFWEGRLDEVLPAESLALTYRLGISLRLAREYFSFPTSLNPLQALVSALNSAIESSESFASQLESWEPTWIDAGEENH
jgi:hypothetical protein